MEVQSIMQVNLPLVNCVANVSLQCALQMKIPILRSTWITECHAIWKQGDDVDVHEVPPIPTVEVTKTDIHSRYRAFYPIDFPYSPNSWLHSRVSTMGIERIK